MVEAINIPRQPLPQVDAIYLLTPTKESIEFLIADYADKKKPQYGDVHLFFTSHLNDQRFAQLKAANVVNRIKTLKEINCEFLALESNVFSVDRPQALWNIYSPQSQESRPEQAIIANRVCSKETKCTRIV